MAAANAQAGRGAHALRAAAGASSGVGRNRRRRRGASLVETVAALAVVAIACVAVASVLATSLKLDEANRENAAAYEAARARLELVRAEPFTRVLDSFDADPANDPDGAGTAEGATFWVASMNRLGDPADVVAEVVLPLNDAGEAREDLALPELGLPADLNGDGAIDAIDHRDDLIVIPVGVRISWTGATGARTYFLATRLHE